MIYQDATRISPHFTWREVIASQTAQRKGIDNTPLDAHLGNLLRTAEVLERIREAAGAPIRVTSWYRTPALCEAIGSTAASRHARGLAADIECSAHSTAQLAFLIARTAEPLDELILEYWLPSDRHSGWVHVGLHDDPDATGLTILRKQRGTPYERLTDDDLARLAAGH